MQKRMDATQVDKTQVDDPDLTFVPDTMEDSKVIPDSLQPEGNCFSMQLHLHA